MLHLDKHFSILMPKTTISSTANNMFQEKDKLMHDGNEEFSLNIESLKIKHVSLFFNLNTVWNVSVVAL